MLSSKENTQRLFANNQPERVGLQDSPWGHTIRKWVTQGYPTEAREAGKPPVPVDPGSHFRFDMYGIGGGYDMMPLRHVDEVVEESEAWKVVRNGSGALLKWWKDKDGTPEHIDFTMTNRSIWERDYRPHLLSVDRDRVDIAGARAAFQSDAASERWTFYGTLFIWEHMRRSLGDLCMYESLLTDPDWIDDFNRVYTDHLKQHFALLLEEGGIPDGVWIYEDLGFKDRLFCSPHVLSELFFPYYKEVVDFFHSYNMKVVLHTCGFTMDALPLIVEAGFDGLHPMEVAAGNDIFSAAEQYSDNLVFVGGLDKRILETHDKELIRAEVTKFIEGMKARQARFIFGSDHSISTVTDYQDFCCALEVYRELMEY